jgi:FKBP-type peptidyl-prolyl cis-trans isomerase 2
MRILIVSVLLLSLASCTAPWSKPAAITPPASDANTATTQGITGSVTPPAFAVTGSVVTLNYTLHTDSETGPLQETTLQTVAQANGLYKTGTTYQPFQVALGQNQVIYGFEQGLMGVKKGEKKIIKVVPSEGYGRPVTISKDQIAPEFSLTRDKKMFEDTLKQTIKKSEFPTEMQAKVAEAKVGDSLTGAQNAIAKVVEVTADSITLTIENSANPFYKKELVVGATALTENADFKITAVDANNVTLSITNKKSPFYNKNFAVGESITPQNGSKITIKEIGDTSVSILADHPFMTKDLYFDVEIVDIQ